MLLSGLNQVVTYWSPTGDADRYGKPILNAPVQIQARWEDKQTQIVNKQGSEVLSKARVFTLIEVDIDGYIAKGTFADTDPRPLDAAWSVQQVSTTPNLRNMQTLFTVYL